MRAFKPLSCHAWAISGLMLVMCWCSPVTGQLKVLSQGNASEEWRKAQLATIDVQLADRSLVAELRKELESQKKWLAAYKPGTLSAEPKNKQSISDKRWEEPALDPTQLASSLRGKLLGPKASPTTADTESLRNALQQSPNDLGLRQLQLHWLDQPQYREDYSMEIADAASRVLALLESVKLDPETKKLATIFTLYRQARALGYRQDPDVVARHPLSDGDREAIEQQLVGVYNQLIQLTGPGRPEFCLLEIRMLRRDHWLGRALELLETNAATIDLRWYLEKRRDILRELGWKPAAEEAHQRFAAQFPEEAQKYP